MMEVLKGQVRMPDVSFISCGTRFVGPEGEALYEVNNDPATATESLLSLNKDEIQGPSSHPSTMFRRALYEDVGGYRAAFYFAQDLDLWIRLAERGTHFVMPEVLYEASVTVESISGMYRKEQIEMTRMILECARLRRSGESEAPALEKAALIKPRAKGRRNRLRRARALYFIGACLTRRHDPQARGYFRQALRAFPLHFKSAARLFFGG